MFAKNRNDQGFGKDGKIKGAENEGGADLPRAETVTEPSVKTAPAYGQNNKIFTADAAEKARAILRAKLKTQLSSGIDPEMMQAGITLAGYHVEAGARSFAAYSKAMIADLGEGIRPYLKSFYDAIRSAPGIIAS